MARERDRIGWEAVAADFVFFGGAESLLGLAFLTLDGSDRSEVRVLPNSVAVVGRLRSGSQRRGSQGECHERPRFTSPEREHGGVYPSNQSRRWKRSSDYC